MIDKIYLILILATYIKAKPFKKTKAEVEKLLGKINNEININGATKYQIIFFKLFKLFLFLLNCLAKKV